MDSRVLIDAQFDRAVQIVQSLPKNGPIQTGYEEKLTMYSLYKQATVGNVESPRPSVWDMLGRAKWDAWAKHKDLDPYEAKWLYVDALLKVLRRYSDKTVAMDLVRELESFTGDPSNMVMSGSLSRSGASTSSGSTASDDDHQPHFQPSAFPPPFRQNQAHPAIPGQMPLDHPLDQSSSDDEDEDDEERDQVPPVPSVYAPSQLNRPQSSMSSCRYRTPTAGSMLVSSPPAGMAVPATQPLPEFQTASAFAEGGAAPSSGYPASVGSYHDRFPHSSSTDLPSSLPSYPGYRVPSRQQQRRPYASYAGAPQRPPSRPTIERAVENIQATLAALTERVETLEELAHRSAASLSLPGRISPRWTVAARNEYPVWDLDDMGMWSIVLQPLARLMTLTRYIMVFLARSRGRSPTVVVLRRLLLDISFMLCVLAIAKAAWNRSGIRRREVVAAFVGLWHAIVGQKHPRRLVDRGV